MNPSIRPAKEMLRSYVAELEHPRTSRERVQTACGAAVLLLRLTKVKFGDLNPAPLALIRFARYQLTRHETPRS